MKVKSQQGNVSFVFIESKEGTFKLKTSCSKIVLSYSFGEYVKISWAFPSLITISIFRLVIVWQAEERVSVTSICRQPVLIWSNPKILWTSIILKEVCTFRSKLVAEDLVSVDHFLTLPRANHSFNRYSRSWNNYMYLWKRMF